MRIREVGKYRSEEQIGSGSYGKVYKGRDKTTGEVVAMKVIERRGKNKREFEGLRQEVQILKKLNHPNIILLKDHYEAENFMILIMEYAPKDLACALQKTVHMREEEVRRIGSEILSALVYLHENRIVHRDLKPQNILLSEAGSVKICDFGFARKMSPATVNLHSMKGTPLYIAPEIIEERPYGPKIDVWSLGIIMYELFLGSPPFIAENFQKLTVKIIRDKVVYPSNMSLELRELIDGMLQKNPNNRYDWPAIQKHPFFNPPPPPPPPPVEVKPVVLEPVERVVEPIKIIEEVPVAKPPVPVPPAGVLSPRKVLDSYDMMFSVMMKSYEVSKSIASNKELTLEQLKDHEKQLKAGNGKQLKTDILFYHQVLALFNSALNEENNQKFVDMLVMACKVLILLISKVRLEDVQQGDDITRKRDLSVVVAKLIAVVDDEECLSQLATLCLYLLKSTFSPIQKEVDMDVALDLIESSSKVLKREDLSVQLLTVLCKTLGTLAGQASLTIRNSLEVFKMINECKLLTAVAGRYRPEKEFSTIFECLQKFVHATKLEYFSAELRETVYALASDIAEGLLPVVQYFPQAANIYAKIQLEYFFRVIYAAVKASQDFDKAVFSKGWNKDLYDVSKLYSTAMSLCAVKKHGLLLKEDVVIAGEGEVAAKDPLPVFQSALAYWYIYQNPDKRSISKLQSIVRKIAQLLTIEDNTFGESIRELEGWPISYAQYTSQDLLLETAEGLLQLEPTLLTTMRQGNIIFNVVRGDKLSLNPRSLLSYLNILERDTQAYDLDQRTFSLLQTVLRLVMTEESVGKIRQAPEHIHAPILSIVFGLISKLISKDQSALNDFFQHLQSENVHRVAFIDPLLNQGNLMVSLRVVNRILKKCDPNVLDFVAVQALPRLKSHFDTQNTELLARLLQVTSMVARAKPDYYPKLQVLELGSKAVRYLSHPDLNIRIKALNLIGNMGKHNGFFLEQFKKNEAPAAIIGTLSSAGGNQESLVYQAIFAFGNICYFGQQYSILLCRPQSIVTPLIPYLYEALFVPTQAFLCNALGTLTHLIRHSSIHIKTLLEYKMFPKVVDLVQETKFPAVQNRGASFLDKALDIPEVLATYPLNDVKVSLARVKPLSAETKDRLEKILAKLAGR